MRHPNRQFFIETGPVSRLQARIWPEVTLNNPITNRPPLSLEDWKAWGTQTGNFSLKPGRFQDYRPGSGQKSLWTTLSQICLPYHSKIGKKHESLKPTIYQWSWVGFSEIRMCRDCRWIVCGCTWCMSILISMWAKIRMWRDWRWIVGSLKDACLFQISILDFG